MWAQFIPFFVSLQGLVDTWPDHFDWNVCTVDGILKVWNACAWLHIVPFKWITGWYILRLPSCTCLCKSTASGPGWNVKFRSSAVFKTERRIKESEDISSTRRCIDSACLVRCCPPFEFFFFLRKVYGNFSCALRLQRVCQWGTFLLANCCYSSNGKQEGFQFNF